METPANNRVTLEVFGKVRGSVLSPSPSALTNTLKPTPNCWY